MAEKKKTEWTDVLMGMFSPNYIFIQCAMFVIHYGFKMNLPTWVMWFPTWVYLSFILLMGIVLIIITVITAIAS